MSYVLEYTQNMLVIYKLNCHFVISSEIIMIIILYLTIIIILLYQAGKLIISMSIFKIIKNIYKHTIFAIKTS